MNKKQAAALAVLIVGVILIALGSHSTPMKGEPTPLRTSVVSAPNSDHVVKIIGEKPPKTKPETARKTPSATGPLVAVGIVLILLGGGGVYYFGKKTFHL